MYKINFYCLIPCLISLFSLILTACGTPKPTQPLTELSSPQWLQHKHALQQLRYYQVRGAFAYISDKKRTYARFFWQQDDPEHYRLMLINPLGGSELELTVQPGFAQLTDNLGKCHIDNNPEALIQRLMDMSVPLNRLRLWILGLPADASQVTLNSQHRLKQLRFQHQEQSWTVDYQAYYEHTLPQLPKKLELKQKHYRIKLKIDDWTVK